MRKIFASLLALALVLTSFCMVSFADNEDIYFTEPTFNESKTEATVYLVVKTPSNGLAAITVNYTVNGSSSYVVTDTGACKTYDESMTMEAGTNVTFMAGGDGVPAGTGSLQIAKFVVTKESSNVTISIDSVEMYDNNFDPDFGETAVTKGATITWSSSAPEVTGTSTTAQGTTFGNYKDVPLFKYEATVSNTTESTKFYMTPELFLDGTSAGTKAKTLIPGLTVDGEGKIVVNIAIVGAPEGTVTINPNITAE